MELTLYHRRDCRLCQELEEAVGRYAHSRHPATPLTLHHCDIDASPAWGELYGDRIPVLVHDGQVILEGNTDPAGVAAALDQLDWGDESIDLSSEPPNQTPLQRIYTGRDAVDAHLLRSMLKAQGIRAMVQGEPLAIAPASFPFTQGTLPSVWVLAPDAPAALAVVEEYRHPAHLPGPGAEAGAAGSWKCPNCGEMVEPQFTSCWKCQASRPEPQNEP